MSAGGVRVVRPQRVTNTELFVPGDKSVSQRAVMLGALAQGQSRVRRILQGGDVKSTLSACVALGAEAVWDSDDLLIKGVGGRFIPSATDLDFGNSGTGIRLMSGLLAGHNFESTLCGDDSLSKRPMTRIQLPLELMGARLSLTNERFPPFTIHGGGLKAIDYELPMPSAQVKSCVLLAGLFAEGVTRVVEPVRCRNHTENMFQALGLPLTVDDGAVSVSGSSGAPLELNSFDWLVPGDFSSAAFWLTAAAISDGKTVLVKNVGLNPGRSGLLNVLRRMGAGVEVSVDPESPESEPSGDVVVRGCGLKGTTVGGDEVPDLIDELPLVAVLGACAEGETVIKDADELRVKESDRIALMVNNLSAMGVDVTEHKDGLSVRGSDTVPGGGVVQSCGDHRMAMSATILSTRAEKGITVEGADCIDTSYPTFWDDFGKVTSDVV